MPMVQDVPSSHELSHGCPVAIANIRTVAQLSAVRYILERTCVVSESI